MQPVTAGGLTERNWSVLGLLRFLLAVSVMISHSDNVIGQRAWIALFPRLTAVIGFFMISGFSIAYSYSARPDGFIPRRLLRVYPLSIAVVALSVEVFCLKGGVVHSFSLGTVGIPTVAETISTLLLANGLLFATPFLLHPFYSLDCEMVYYLIAPWLLRASTKVIWIMFALSVAVHGLFVLHLVPFISYAQARFGFAIAALLWAWLAGVLAFRLPGNQLYTVFVAVACNLFLAYADISIISWLPCALVAVCVCNIETIRLPQSLVAAGNYLGDLSYPLYLVHFPVLLLLGDYLRDRLPQFALIVCWTAALLLSAALYHGIDRPLRRKRRGRLRSAIPLPSLQ